MQQSNQSDVPAMVRRTLPAEPSRKSVRWHALAITVGWGLAGLTIAWRGSLAVDYQILATIGIVQIAALLVHTSSKTIDLNRWMTQAANIAKRFAPGGSA